MPLRTRSDPLSGGLRGSGASSPFPLTALTRWLAYSGRLSAAYDRTACVQRRIKLRLPDGRVTPDGGRSIP